MNCKKCNAPLLECDEGEVLCLLCRLARLKGLSPKQQQQAMTTIKKRAKPRPVDDPFKGFRDEDEEAERKWRWRTGHL
jgi:uncharacterized Zn finger protein (UPF0148 family)